MNEGDKTGPYLLLQAFASTFGERQIFPASVIEPRSMKVNHPYMDDSMNDKRHHRKKFSGVSSACHLRW